MDQDHAQLRRALDDAVIKLAFLLGDAGAIFGEHRRRHVVGRAVAGDKPQAAGLGRDPGVRVRI